jgi:hypothetical protein
MADSLRIYELLKAHLPEPQARTMTHAIQQAEADIAKDVKSVVDAAFMNCAAKADLAMARADLANAKAELIRWMFVFWVGQIAAAVGILKLVK